MFSFGYFQNMYGKHFDSQKMYWLLDSQQVSFSLFILQNKNTAQMISYLVSVLRKDMQQLMYTFFKTKCIYL